MNIISNFSTSLAENIKYRRHFNEKAFSHGNLFTEYYLEKISCFNEVYQNAIPKCVEYIQNTIDDAVAVLLDNGIFDYDRNSFMQRFGIDDNFISDISAIVLKQQEIEEFVNNLQDFRNIQRNSRSHWQGGGFGIRGAIKGAVKAGILNAGTGILRGIGDSMINSVDNRKINSMKREAFENGNFGEILRDSLYRTDVRIGYCVCVVLYEHGKISSVVEIIDEDSLQRKLNNVKAMAAANKFPIQKLVSDIAAWILQNPFSFKYYACLYFLLGKKENSLSQLCSYLGYGKEFESYKEIFADSVVSGLLNDNNSTEETLKSLRQVKDMYEIPNSQLQRFAEIENALLTQQKSQNEIAAQIQESSLDESKADDLLQAGKIEEVWAMLNGQNALIEYKLAKYYENLVKPFIDRRDFANIERRMNYAYEQSDNGNPFAIYFVSYIRRLVYLRMSDKDKVIRMDEKILKLADNGQISACASVGFYCYEGQGYFKRDYKEAFKYLSFAAEKNQPTAMAWLGEMYFKGDGVEKNLQLAEKWLTLAAHYGHPYAIKQLEKLYGRN